MTIKGIVTSNKGHVTLIEKVREGVSGNCSYHVTHQVWWNSVKRRLRNQPEQVLAFFGDL